MVKKLEPERKLPQMQSSSLKTPNAEWAVLAP